MLDPRQSVAENPFYVLELRPDCSRADVEREGQKLLGMLELRLAQAATYATPLGVQSRTPDRVRQAMADLRDPQRRLMFEVWARIPADATLDDAESLLEGADVAPPRAQFAATSAALEMTQSTTNYDFTAPPAAAPSPDPWADARRALGWGP